VTVKNTPLRTGAGDCNAARAPEQLRKPLSQKVFFIIPVRCMIK
jgi:hypothetical protein